MVKKVVKKKVVKAKPVKVVKAVKVKVAKPVKEVKAAPVVKSFETEIKGVLFHILTVFKAAILDSFRQYLESQINNGRTPSVDQFMESIKHTVASHGITKDELLAGLTEVELEAITGATAKEIVKSTEATITKPLIADKAPYNVVEKKAALEPATEDLSGDDPLDPIANKAEVSKKSVFDALADLV